MQRESVVEELFSLSLGTELRSVQVTRGREIKNGKSYLYRTATTTYRCCLPALAGFSGSWSYKTFAGTNIMRNDETKIK